MKKLEDLKVGDDVWTIQKGWVKLLGIDNSVIYSFQVGRNWYTKDGKYSGVDKHPSLFTYNPLEKFEPRWMMVVDSEKNWEKRWCIGKTGKEYNFICAYDVYNKDDIEGWDGRITSWKFAKEIETEEINEITLEDIAKKFNVDVKTIRIKEICI